MVSVLLLLGCFLSTPEQPPPSPEWEAAERRRVVMRIQRDKVVLAARREELEQRLLTEQEAPVRDALAFVVGEAFDPRSIPALTAALAVEQDPKVQTSLMVSLLRFRDQAAIDGVVARYLHGVDPSVEKRFLGGFGGAEPRNVRDAVARLAHLNPERAEQISEEVDTTSGPVREQ